jgi:hypothetical protein
MDRISVPEHAKGAQGKHASKKTQPAALGGNTPSDSDAMPMTPATPKKTK